MNTDSTASIQSVIQKVKSTQIFANSEVFNH